MTLAEMLSDLYRRFNYGTSPDATVTTRLTAHLNEIQRDILTDPDFAALLRHQQTFSSVADEDYYGLRPSIARIVSLRDTVNRIPLTEMSEARYRRLSPNPAAQSGLPTWYVNLGLFAAVRRPADASEIFAKSTSAGDTQALHYELVTSTGATFTGSVSLTGTTAVSLSASITTAIEVQDVYLASAAAGTVTIHEDSGVGTEISRINIGRLRARVWRIALVPTPSSAIDYTVDAEREVTDLVQTFDEPVLPIRWHDLLVTGAKKLECEFRDDQLGYARASRDFDRGLGTLRARLAGTSVIVPGGEPIGVSQLGAWFPPDYIVR